MTSETTGPKTHRRLSRGLRTTLIVLGVLAVLIIAIRIFLDPIATRIARGQLHELKGFDATFSDLHIDILPPGVTLTRFKLIETPKGRWDEPLIFVDRTNVGIAWRKLLHGQLVARARVEGPKFVAATRHEEKAEKAPEAGEQLNEMIPLKLDRLEIVDGEVLLASGHGKGAPKMWVHDLDMVAQNLATTKKLMDDQPATLRLTGKVQRSGDVHVDASLDPWTKRPTFTAKAALEKLDVRELHGFLVEKAGVKAASGQINVFAELKANDGAVKGGVKPVLKDVDIDAANGEIASKLKALLADAAVEILSNDDGDDKGRETIATVVPIRGNIKEPNVQLVPAVLGTVRNAFVVGLHSGFSGLPPKTAPEKEGVIKQAIQALKKDDGPPEAQPDKQDAKPRRGHRSGGTPHR